MADHKNSSFVLFQCVFQLLFRVHVKMVRRLVEDKEVSFAVDEFAEAHFCLLAAGKDTHQAFNVLCGKTAFGERCADFILGIGWKFFPDFLDTTVGIAFWHFLRNIRFPDNRQAPRFRQGTESNRGYSLRVLFFRFRWHR